MQNQFTCSCCDKPKIYINKRGLRKHQQQNDPKFIFGGTLSDEYKKSSEEQYLKNPRSCDQCKSNFSYDTWIANKKRRFCSRSCATTYNNNRAGTGSKGYNSQETACLCCNKIFTRKSSKRKFCNTRCSATYRNDILVRAWLQGDISGTDADGSLNESIRKYLMEQAGYVCSKCGWGEVHPVTGRVPLQVDHIDGNSVNNCLNNLRILCPNCHSLTPTFGSLNRGNGREQRRIYREAQKKLGRKVD